MKSPAILIPLFLLLLLPGCSGRSGNPDHEFLTVIEEGVTTAINRGGPRYTEPLFRFEEVLELQEDPANEASLLFHPRGFVQDEAGNSFVIDAGNSRIALFDPGGAFIRGIGREGEGPGEFRYLGEMQVTGGILQVFDSRLNRLSRFRDDGTLLEVIPLGPLRADLGLQYIHTALVTATNRLVLTAQQDIPDPDFQVARQRLVVLDAERRLLWESATPEYKLVVWAVFRGVRGLGAPLPFAPMGWIAVQPDQGILVSHGDVPVLTRYDLDGRPQLRIRMDEEPRPFTAADRARVIADYDRRIAEATAASVEQFRAWKDALILPEYWPRWGGAGLDEAGYIWLSVEEHEADREAAGGGTLYRVLDPRGEYLGEVRLPSLHYSRFCHGRLLGQRSDPETGAAHLVVFRIVPAVAGLTYPD
jgi:hypothetical protein